MRRANGRREMRNGAPRRARDAAVIEALERDAREATDAETAQIKREQEQHTTEVLQGLAAERDRHNADTVLAASGGMLDSEYSSDDAAPPPETPAPAPPDSSSDDDDAAVPPAAASTEAYIPPQTRKKKVDYGAFSASMTRGAADEFDDYDQAKCLGGYRRSGVPRKGASCSAAASAWCGGGARPRPCGSCSSRALLFDFGGQGIGRG